MAEKNDDKTMKSSTFNLGEVLAEAGIKTVDAIPAKPAEEPKEAKGGAFIAGDGRMMYKYTVDDQTIITPKPLDQLSEEDFYSLPISLAGAQAGRLPQNLTVKWRDPHIAGHWFNRKAADGRRVSEAMALGYVPAKREDCEWVSSSLNDEDGAIIDNDLVLMKISKAKLFLQYKQWMDLAKIKGGKNSYKQTAEGAVGATGGKVDHYFTPQAEKEYSGLGAVTHLPTAN
jgi:hypothetical protein